MTTGKRALLTGGPRDGHVVEVDEGSGLIAVEADGAMHRYIATMRRARVGQADLPVYIYDGDEPGTTDR